MNAIYGAFELGLIYGLVALGVYLTLRIINFPDLTVNGSFTLGASVCSVLILHNCNPILAIICAGIAGGIAGAVTAMLNVICKIQNLLAGIIMTIALYSINLRVMGRPNVVLDNATNATIYNIYNGNLDTIVPTLCIVGMVALFLILFLVSEIGLAIRASGHNPSIGEAYGISYSVTVTTIMVISNALVALSGALFAQLQGFSDITMGNGTIVIGLASVIIGERIITKSSIPLTVIGCVLGTVIYKWIIASALNVAHVILQASDIYLITSILVVLIMVTKGATHKA